MIRMIDKDGDGQVCFEEFYKMVTGGRVAPPGLGGGGKHASRNTATPSSGTAGIRSNSNGNKVPPPPTGQTAIDARNTKRRLLDEFSRDNNLKPESIKRAHRRYVAMDKNNTGLMDYTEFCEILQVDPSPQSEEVFSQYDYRKADLVDAKEVLIALANFTGAGKNDK